MIQCKAAFALAGLGQKQSGAALQQAERGESVGGAHQSLARLSGSLHLCVCATVCFYLLQHTLSAHTNSRVG